MVRLVVSRRLLAIRLLTRWTSHVFRVARSPWKPVRPFSISRLGPLARVLVLQLGQLRLDVHLLAPRLELILEPLDLWACMCASVRACVCVMGCVCACGGGCFCQLIDSHADRRWRWQVGVEVVGDNGKWAGGFEDPRFITIN